MDLDRNVKIAAFQAVTEAKQLLKNIHKLGVYKLHDNLTPQLDFLPDFEKWSFVLSFMTRKIGALYLGSNDYDYGVNDFYFSFEQPKINKDNFMQSGSPDKKYLTEYEVLDLFNISLPQLYSLMKSDSFPKPKEISGRRTRYLLSEVLDWKKQKYEEVF